MDQRDKSGYGRRDVLKATGAMAAAAGLGGVASASRRNCDREVTRTATGTLSGVDDGDTFTYTLKTDDPCKLVIELSGERGTDFDRRSWNYGSDERVTIRGGQLSAENELGILVDAYSGGEYELATTERGAGTGNEGSTIFRVRVENTAPADFYDADSATGGAILITPGAYAVHTEANPLFTHWLPASDGLEAIAEAGRPGGTPENQPGLVSELASDDTVVTAGAITPAHTVADPNDPQGEVPGIPPIAPGGAFEFTVSGAPGERFSFASMFVPSNDVFFAPYSDGIPLFRRNGDPVSGDVTDWIDLWDAGTEPNGRPGFDEDGAPLQSHPDQGDDEGSSVRNLSWVWDGHDYPAAGDAIRVTVEPTSDGTSSQSLVGRLFGGN